ncbi:MAG: aminotransferase class III-fold pyridoxal phosphate-dependent enzyme, partial [Candidatus Methanodesulfokora sp.]
ELQEDHEMIGDVRGKGLMVGVELVKDRRTKEPARKERDMIIEEAFKKGLMLLGASKSALRLAPPLIIKREEIDIAIEIIDSVIKEVEGHMRS